MAPDGSGTAGVDPDAIRLRLRLDRLFAELAAEGQRPSVKEIADAITVALASRDLVPDGLDRLAIRLRAVLVKRPEPHRRRAFDRAFDAAFRGPVPPPDPRPLTGPDREDVADAVENAAMPQARPANRRPVRVAIAALVIVGAVVAALSFRSLIAPVGDTPYGTAPPVENTGDRGAGTGGGGPSGHREVSRHWLAPADQAEIAAIAFDIKFLADADGIINLARIARDLRHARPPGLSVAQFGSALSRETRMPLSVPFDIAAPDTPALVIAIARLGGLDPEIAASAASPVISEAFEAADRAVNQIIPPEVRRLDQPFARVRDAPREIAALLPEGPIRDGFQMLAPALGPDSLRFPGPAAVEPSAPGVMGELYLGLFLLPLGAAAYRVLTWRRRMRAWFRKRAPDQGVTPHYLGGLQEALDRAVGSDTRVRAARDLARPVRTPTRRVNATTTAHASALNCGRLTPVFRTARRTPRYLALIVTEGPDDHLAKRFRELVRAFDRLRTTIDTWYIDHDGNTVFQHFDDPRRTLAELHARMPDRRLLVLGSGRVFLDTATGLVHGWAQVITRWPASALLTPVTHESWGAEEVVLATLFGGRLSEATPEGLAEVSAALAGGGASDLRLAHRPAPRYWDEEGGALTRHDRPDDEDLHRIGRELMAELGPAGMLWLRAAAVYPSVNWDLTLYLGQRLTWGPRAEPLITARRFARLSALPWFREGYMPPWARIWLTSGLSETERTTVVSLLCGRLGEAGADPSGNGAEAPFVTADDVAPSISGLGDGDADGPGPVRIRRDAVFLEMLSTTPPEGERMEATRDLAERFSAVRRGFLWREAAVLTMLATYGAGAGLAYTALPRGAGAVGGTYLPLIVLGAGLLACVAGTILARPPERRERTGARA